MVMKKLLSGKKITVSVSLYAMPLKATNYGYDEQLCKLYSRNVYTRFKETFKSSTSFTMRADLEKPGYFYVKHRKVETTFPWIQHEFLVKAEVDREDPEKSVFGCECLT